MFLIMSTFDFIVYFISNLKLIVIQIIVFFSTSDVVIFISIKDGVLSSHLTLILTEYNRRSQFCFGAK